MNKFLRVIVTLLIIVTCFNLIAMAEADSTEGQFNIEFSNTLSPNKPTPNNFLFDQLCELNKYWSVNPSFQCFEGSESEILDQADLYQVSSDQVILSHEDLIQLHLSKVEQHLRSKKTSHLTKSQQIHREKGLDILHDYWQAKQFPQNRYHEELTPYFIDDFNTACAVGHILRESGGEALASKIATENNYAFIEEMDYPELGKWANKMGFTVEELKWIQPTYQWLGPNENIFITVQDLSCTDEGAFSVSLTATGSGTGEYGIYTPYYGTEGPDFQAFSEGETFFFEGETSDATNGLYSFFIYDALLADAPAKEVFVNVSNCNSILIPNPPIFEENTWLYDLINPNNCNASDAVEVYDFGSYGFFAVTTNEGEAVYLNDGTLYCTSAPGLDCFEAYGLTGNFNDSWACDSGGPIEYVTIGETVCNGDGSFSIEVTLDASLPIDNFAAFLPGNPLVTTTAPPPPTSLIPGQAVIVTGYLDLDGNDESTLTVFNYADFSTAYSIDVSDCNIVNNCDVSDPLSLPWIQEIIVNADPTECAYAYEIVQVDYNGATYFSVRTEFSSNPDCPVPGIWGTPILDCNGETYCLAGEGPTDEICSDALLQALFVGEIIWELDNTACDVSDPLNLPWVQEVIAEADLSNCVYPSSLTQFNFDGATYFGFYYEYNFILNCPISYVENLIFDCNGEVFCYYEGDCLDGVWEAYETGNIIWEFDNGGNDNQIFIDFPWLSAVTGSGNCLGGDYVTVYQSGVYNFIYVNSAGSGVLYFQDGTFYCAESQGFSCINAYGLTEVIAEWQCDGPVIGCGEILPNIVEIIGVEDYEVLRRYFVNAQSGTEIYYLTSGCAFSDPPLPADLYDCQGNYICTDCPIPADFVDCFDCAPSEVIIYTGPDCGGNPTPGIFTDYPWLSELVDINDCAGTTVDVYTQGNYEFICIQAPSGNVFYFEDGTYYCADSPGFSCVAAYGLSSPSTTWSCGEGPEPPIVNPFENYPWLNAFVEPDCDLNIYEFTSGNYMFIYIQSETTGMGELYFQDGTFYCADSPNYSCVGAYGFNFDDAEFLYSCSGKKESDSNSVDSNELTILQSTFKMYPNPTQGQLFLNLSANADQDQSIAVYDLSGRTMQQVDLLANSMQTTLEINLVELPKGIYLVEWRTPSHSEVQRLVID